MPSPFDPFRNSFPAKPLQWWSRDMDVQDLPLQWWSRDLDFEDSPLQWWSRDLDFEDSFYPYGVGPLAFPIGAAKPSKKVKVQTTPAPAKGSKPKATTQAPGAQQQTTAGTPTTAGTITTAVPTIAAGISTSTQPQTATGTTQPQPLATTLAPAAPTNQPIVTSQTPALVQGQTTPASPAALSSAGSSTVLISTSSPPPQSISPGSTSTLSPGIVSFQNADGSQSYFVPPRDGGSGVRVFMTGPGSFSGSSGSGGSFVSGTGNFTLVDPLALQSLGDFAPPKIDLPFGFHPGRLLPFIGEIQAGPGFSQ